jgi:hypothetical protein
MALADARTKLRKANDLLVESERALHKHDYDGCDKFFARASDLVADGAEAIASPTEPGTEAADLPARSGGSGSVHVPGNLERFAWMSDRLGRTRDRKLGQVSDNLNALGLESRKLSSATILQRLAESGWGPDELAEYVKNLMEVTKDQGTIRQRVEVTKLVFGVLQHTEPRTLFEMKDADLSDLSEDELEELSRTAALHVAEQAARLQAGLPPSTTGE